MGEKGPVVLRGHTRVRGKEGRCENVTVLLSFVKLTQATSFWEEETKVRNCLHQLTRW